MTIWRLYRYVICQSDPSLSLTLYELSHLICRLHERAATCQSLFTSDSVNEYGTWAKVNKRLFSSEQCICMLWTQVCDFGLAKWKDYSQTHTNSRSNRAGTVTHIPPEIWVSINNPRTVKYDVYSFAVLLWELFTEEKPFKTGNYIRLFSRFVIDVKIVFVLIFFLTLIYL